MSEGHSLVCCAKAAQAHLADALRRFQQRRNLNARAIARLLGVSESYVAKLLKGSSWPGPGVLLELRRQRVLNLNRTFDQILRHDQEAA